MKRITPGQAERYSKALAEAIESASDGIAANEDTAAALVTDALREMTRRLARIDPSSWEAKRLASAIGDIDRIARDMGLDLGNTLLAAQAAAAGRGGAAVTRPLIEMDILPPGYVEEFPILDETVVSLLSGFRTDLVGGLARDARDTMARIVSQAMLTGEPQTTTIAKIERLLAREGNPLSGLEARARTIYVTETHRAMGLAQRAQGTILSRVFPGLLHGWRNQGDKKVRPDHVRAGSGGYIPFKKRFLVGGIRMLYPREVPPKKEVLSAAWARQTIRCRCWEDLVIPGFMNPKEIDMARAERAAVDDLEEQAPTKGGARRGR